MQVLPTFALIPRVPFATLASPFTFTTSNVTALRPYESYTYALTDENGAFTTNCINFGYSGYAGTLAGTSVSTVFRAVGSRTVRMNVYVYNKCYDGQAPSASLTPAAVSFATVTVRCPPPPTHIHTSPHTHTES